MRRGVLSFELVVPGDSTAERKLEVAETLVARLESASARDEGRVRGHAAVDAGHHDRHAMFRFRKARRRPRCVEEQRTQTPEERTQTRQVSPGYLRALGARLVGGRVARRARRRGSRRAREPPLRGALFPERQRRRRHA